METAALKEMLDLEEHFSSHPVSLDEIDTWEDTRLWKWLKASRLRRRMDLLEVIATVKDADSNVMRGQAGEIDEMLESLKVLKFNIEQEIKGEKEKSDD